MKKIVKAISFVLLILVFLTGCNFFSKEKSLLFYNDLTLVKKIVTDGNETINVPEAPLKEGYSFLGWYTLLDEQVTSSIVEDKELKSSVIIKAKWEIINYNITYVLDGGTSTNPNTYTIEDNITLTNPTKFGSTFLGWSINNEETYNSTITISKGTTGDKEYIARWTDTIYSLYFNSNGGSTVAKITSAGGKAITKPDNPTKEGYNFLGWYNDNNLFTFDVMPYKSITLKAKWELKEYSVSFTNEDFETLTITIEDEIRIPNPTKKGYEFLGWGTSREKDVVLKNINEDVVLTSYFQIKQYTISFEANGGSNINPITQNYNTTVTKPTDPTKEGDSFLGWFKDSNFTTTYNFSLMEESITVYAKWQNMKAYTFNYYSIDATCNVTNNSQIYENKIIELNGKAIIDGNIFDGWYNNDTLLSKYNYYSFSMPKCDYSVNARYKEVSMYTYDKANSTNLTINESGNIFGQGITTSDYTNKIISKNYLDKLEPNLYAFYVNDNTILIKIIDNSIKPKNVRVDYDINYPKATLIFEENTSYEYFYSINGSNYITCYSGMIIPNYNKEINNIIDVKCGTIYTSISIEGDSQKSDYYNNYFTIDGNKYDYNIENEEDMLVFIKYVYGVYVPTQSTYNAKDNSYNSSIDFIINNDYNQDFSWNYYLKLCDELSFPYSHSHKLVLEQSIYTISVKVIDSFSTEKTSQANTKLVYTLETSSRGEDFNDFYIDSLNKVEEIDSLYELENLSFGVRPIIIDSRANTVYEKARSVLRTYVDDNMNDYEKAKVIYDWLAINVTYDDVLLTLLDSEYVGKYASFTTYGVFQNGVAVCDGIASAYKLMCNIEGIECVEIIGETSNAGHAWNKVFINGFWYGVDATWSRPSSIITHQYLFCNEYYFISTQHYEVGTNLISDMLIEHIASGNNKNYYYMESLGGQTLAVVSNTEFNTIYNYCKNNGIKKVEIYYAGTSKESFANNLTCSYTYAGNVFNITVS